MIKQIINNLNLTTDESSQLDAIKPWKGDHWKSPPNENISAIKQKIRRQLEANQTVCSYCGLKLGETSNGEIEHIAPKSKHPEFTFALDNLTFACHLCNSSKKKGKRETISVKRATYEQCDFLLVHPYFDDPNQHYEWTDNQIEILIQVKDKSPKGSFSIKMFGLNTTAMTEARSKQVMFDKFKSANSLSGDDEQSLKDTMEYKKP
jgi:uncharacterized protein (TIGR02646 family)